MGRLTSHFSGLLNSKLWILGHGEILLAEQWCWYTSGSSILRFFFFVVFEFRLRLLSGADLVHKIKKSKKYVAWLSADWTNRVFVLVRVFYRNIFQDLITCALSYTLRLFGNWQWWLWLGCYHILSIVSGWNNQNRLLFLLGEATDH